jgi:hypothetical protein
MRLIFTMHRPLKSHLNRIKDNEIASELLGIL